jgi:hypothetical protein
LNVVSANSFMTLKRMKNLEGVPSCSNNIPGFLKWADTHALGAANVLILNVTSDSRAPVDVENLRVSIIRRSRMLRTTRINCAGGATGYIYSSINLDTDPPKVGYYCNNRRCPAPNVILQKGDSVELHIVAGGVKWLTHWRGQIDLLVSGRLITLNLGNYVSAPYLTTGGVTCDPSGSHWSCMPMPHL